GARAEDDRAVAEPALRARLDATGPRKPLLHLAHLDQRLLRDGERLDQHPDVAQRPRDDVHVALVVHHRLRHEAVQAFDAALREVTGEAEILPVGAAGHAVLVQTRPAYHGDHEFSRLDP